MATTSFGKAMIERTTARGARLRWRPSTDNSKRGWSVAPNNCSSIGRRDATNAIERGERPRSQRCSASASAGITWPAVPPPAMTANTRGDEGVFGVVTTTLRTLPHSAYAILRAIFSNKPAAPRVIKSELPPYEMSGNVRPVTGNTPITPPMLMMACTPNHIVMPAASSAPE